MPAFVGKEHLPWTIQPHRYTTRPIQRPRPMEIPLCARDRGLRDFAAGSILHSFSSRPRLATTEAITRISSSKIHRSRVLVGCDERHYWIPYHVCISTLALHNSGFRRRLGVWVESRSIAHPGCCARNILWNGAYLVVATVAA